MRRCGGNRDGSDRHTDAGRIISAVDREEGEGVNNEENCAMVNPTWLEEENAKLRQANEELRLKCDRIHEMYEYQRGMVEGLKFAVRCNGVSGGEVTA